MNARPLAATQHRPYGEFIHPVPLAALVLLMLNDHWLKGGGLVPRELTGKLSDFAGMLYFPLFLTAAARWTGTILGNVSQVDRVRLEHFLRLTPRKLLISCVLTGIAFTALKLCRPCADLYVSALAMVGQRASVTADPTDLWALVSLVPAYWLGWTKRQGAHPT